MYLPAVPVRRLHRPGLAGAVVTGQVLSLLAFFGAPLVAMVLAIELDTAVDRWLRKPPT